MLKPALLYKEELERRFVEMMYDDAFSYYHGYEYAHEIPNIHPEDNVFQWAIVNSTDDVVGYIQYRIYPEYDAVVNFALVGFDKNPIVGKDVFEHLEMLVKEHRRIEWRSTAKNSIVKHYAKFCKDHGGNHIVLHDVAKDNHGNWLDMHAFEILRDRNLNCTEDTAREDTSIDDTEEISMDELEESCKADDPMVLPESMQNVNLAALAKKCKRLSHPYPFQIYPYLDWRNKECDNDFACISVYTKIRRNTQYIIGVIPMMGYDKRSPFCLTVIHPYTKEIVLTCAKDNTNAAFVAELIKLLVYNYMPNSIIAVDKTLDGISIIDHLLEYKSLRDNVTYKDDNMEYTYSTILTAPIRCKMAELLIEQLNQEFCQLPQMIVSDLENARLKGGQIVRSSKEMRSSCNGNALLSYMLALYIAEKH